MKKESKHTNRICSSGGKNTMVIIIPYHQQQWQQQLVTIKMNTHHIWQSRDLLWLL